MIENETQYRVKHWKYCSEVIDLDKAIEEQVHFGQRVYRHSHRYLQGKPQLGVIDNC